MLFVQLITSMPSASRDVSAQFSNEVSAIKRIPLGRFGANAPGAAVGPGGVGEGVTVAVGVGVDVAVGVGVPVGVGVEVPVGVGVTVAVGILVGEGVDVGVTTPPIEPSSTAPTPEFVLENPPPQF